MEILVIHDHGSRDDTLSVLEGLEDKLGVPIQILPTPHLSRSAARNVGWRAASGEIFFFADSDEIYKEEYVSLAVNKIRSDDVAGVTITGSSWVEKQTLLGRLYTEVYTKIQQQRQKEGGGDLGWAWVFTREAIESVEGYDEDLDQAEDRDIFLRLQANGSKFGLILGEHWYHTRPTKFTTYFKKVLRGSASRIRFTVKHRMWGSLIVNLLPSFAIILLAVTPFISLPLFSFLILVGLIGTFGFALRLYRRWRGVAESRLVVLYVWFSITTRLVTSFGYLFGLFVFLPRVLKVKMFNK